MVFAHDTEVALVVGRRAGQHRRPRRQELLPDVAALDEFFTRPRLDRPARAHRGRAAVGAGAAPPAAPDLGRRRGRGRGDRQRAAARVERAAAARPARRRAVPPARHAARRAAGHADGGRGGDGVRRRRPQRASCAGCASASTPTATTSWSTCRRTGPSASATPAAATGPPSPPTAPARPRPSPEPTSGPGSTARPVACTTWSCRAGRRIPVTTRSQVRSGSAQPARPAP